ncbi:hypothetical protein J4573_49675 [Actinomadura barringtoniae]|uniref:Uncharacterized protein n=1 Tax=Actinomadura barringtoniae TaxID=1427535 RepID=A0A939PMA1_9ACTN|nr:hypothetical protein [Actinomadura barringtoniae]MBO2455235.1 hypothetical protein [Actinomadura barringtoniae]
MAQTTMDTDADMARLEELAQALTGRGYRTMLVTGGGRARLEVLDRITSMPTGTVVCERDTGGEAWFWWSWADRIAPASAPADAAALVDLGLRREHDTA